MCERRNIKRYHKLWIGYPAVLHGSWFIPLHCCPNESFKGLFAKVCLNDAYSGWHLLGSSLVVFGTILAYWFCCISAPDDKGWCDKVAGLPNMFGWSKKNMKHKLALIFFVVLLERCCSEVEVDRLTLRLLRSKALTVTAYSQGFRLRHEGLLQASGLCQYNRYFCPF